MGILDIFKKKSKIDSNLKEDESLVKYFYDELIMSLIMMSLPAGEQKCMIGIGCTGDEILEDFSNFYIEKKAILYR